MIYESRIYKYDFRRFWTKKSFSDSIFTGNITICEADKKSSNLLDVISNFNIKVRSSSKADDKKSNIDESANAL